MSCHIYLDQNFRPVKLEVALPECIICHACMFLSDHTAYVNYLPLGTTVIEVGNNLHFILPEGTFPLPVATSTGPVSSVLTPVSHVHRSTMQQTCLKAAVTPVQRYHTTAPVLIPAPTLKPSPASASAHSGPAASTTSQPAVHAPAVKVKSKVGLF